jgi:hypothetical protein
MGGTGAAGVLAVALAIGGFGTSLSSNADAFVPVANDALAGGLRADAPTDQPTMTTSLGGGAPQDGTKKVIDTVYVLPAPGPVVHGGQPANDANQPADEPRDPGDDNNGGNQAGDDQAGDDQGDDSSADEDEGSEDDADDSDDDDDSDDGEDDGGSEPGDD